jgi:virginiamycin A acetyltransferase
MASITLNTRQEQHTPQFKIGRHSYGNIFIEGSHLLDEMQVGNFCAIGSNVEVMVAGWSHNTDWISTYPFEAFKNKFSNASNIIPYTRTPRTINIGNDVWIGQGVLIMSGVNIGDGACIGANTVVSKDVPPYTIAVGAPMRFIRKRFDDEDIQFLLDLKWWNWSDEKINQYVTIINAGNIKDMKKINQ